MGKSRAEIKAGPWADEADVRVAEARIRGVETRRRKRRGRGEREREWKLREGVRHAGEGEGSEDDDGENMEEGVEEDEGELMEGVEYAGAESLPSLRKSGRQGGSACSRKWKSQGCSESSPSSRRLRSQGGLLESSPSSRVSRSRKL